MCCDCASASANCSSLGNWPGTMKAGTAICSASIGQGNGIVSTTRCSVKSAGSASIVVDGAVSVAITATSANCASNTPVKGSVRPASPTLGEDASAACGSSAKANATSSSTGFSELASAVFVMEKSGSNIAPKPGLALRECKPGSTALKSIELTIAFIVRLTQFG